MHNHKLCEAKVFHCRNFPKKNAFLYKVNYLLLDIDKIPFKSRFLSFNKFNLFSFYNKDYFEFSEQRSPRYWIDSILEKEQIKRPDKIKILTHPRILGYVFNPVSFWFCFDQNDELTAVLARVNNTFKEKHSYLIFNQDQSPIKANQEHFAKKEFHVSPFFKREGKYSFKFDFSDEKIKVFIDYFLQNQLMLQTSLICDCKPLCDRKLAKSFFTIPLLTFKVIILIHYQALKILLKGIKYIKKPTILSNTVTKNSNE